MKLTKSKLKQIIKEELYSLLAEISPGQGATPAHLQGPKILGFLSDEAQELSLIHISEPTRPY